MIWKVCQYGDLYLKLIDNYERITYVSLYLGYKDHDQMKAYVWDGGIALKKMGILLDQMEIYMSFLFY